MPPIGPIKHADLIRYLQRLGWSGPRGGGKHLQMRKGTATLAVPHPHSGDIDRGLLGRILREAGIDRATWEAL